MESADHSASPSLINPLTRYADFKFDFPPNTYPKQVLQTNFRYPPDCGETSYVGHGRLKGRHALVTGGDSGIGRAVEEPDAEDLAQFLAKDDKVKDYLIRIPGDLRSKFFCYELVQKAKEKLGGLDLIVNNAGVTGGKVGNFDTSDPDDWDHVFKVNVYAGLHITQAAAPILPPGSSIIFTVSSAGLSPQPGTVAYSASKGALRNFVNGAAAELIKKGIRVNGVAPGVTYTPLMVVTGFNEKDLDGLVAQLEPQGRVQQPAELAPVYVTLADGQSSYVCGSVYGTHGGILAAY
ncbi:hypothetical protein KVR01_006343 [Diaporthe batatas]|uniref:uncharacterized protein n=1 Tax=Diaporthe batatas TaxID=748121 RepID=UPI001D0398C7|nr:uncharacterized protein KVR01_006343 [Diaporthe batatas]KAG8164425.1 hypothetical protein KVR01_006343 [Diaporthe batatas]